MSEPQFKCIRQPWANLIVANERAVETSIWGTSHRGTLAIYATPGDALDRDDTSHLPHGAIIAIAQLADSHHKHDTNLCDRHSCNPRDAQPFHWVLTDIRALSTPIRCARPTSGRIPFHLAAALHTPQAGTRA